MPESNAHALQLTVTSETEVVMTRAFHAPCELVFQALTRCEHLRRWFGARTSTLEACTLDLRPGGSFRFVQRDADGGLHPITGVYQAVAPPSRLAHTFVYDVDGRREQRLRVSVRLDQRDGVTLLTSTASFADRHERDAYLEGGMQRAAAEGYDRLSELLAVDLSPVADDELVLARMLDAPPDVVFAAWTEPERLDRWWGPPGSELHSQSLDLRPGGAYHYGLRTPSGDALWGTFVYREIMPPERLVYASAFADEVGAAVPNPYASTWPLEMLHTLWLADQGGRTMLVLRARPLDASAAQRRAFARAKAKVSKGLATTLAQLAKHLAEG